MNRTVCLKLSTHTWERKFEAPTPTSITLHTHSHHGCLGQQKPELQTITTCISHLQQPSYLESKEYLGRHSFDGTPLPTIIRIIHPSSRRRQWHPTPVLLPGKSHGQRSLVGCSPWGRKESDTTERLHFHFSLSCIGEGNGNPLQCCCLENPRDGGAWWAAVYGVAQSRT